MLLDAEGEITQKFETCLKYIFSKYCTPSVALGADLPDGAYLNPDALDAWAGDTNGEPLPQDQKDELKETLDSTDDGNLTLKGFIQLYQLQTENDEEETWKDLAKHGFDRHLERN